MKKLNRYLIFSCIIFLFFIININTTNKAIELYGKDWNKLVYDLDESLFSDYTEGEVIE